MAAKPRRIVVVSDLHCGSVMGLCPPKIQIEGGGYYQANKYQQWLYRCWQDMAADIKQLDRPILVINGDAIQGVSHKDGQLIGSELSLQVEIAAELLRPVVADCSRVFFLRGTEWHEGKVSENVEYLAQSLGAEKKASTGQYTRSELYLSLDGAAIHFAHHIGNSSVPHYEATIPTREALIHTSELVRFFGSKAPNLRMIVRSHRHRSAAVWLPPDLWSVVTPAWQLKTSFSYKVAVSMLPEIGYFVIERDGNGLRPIPHIYPILPPHVEEV